MVLSPPWRNAGDWSVVPVHSVTFPARQTGRIAAECALSSPPWNPEGRLIFPAYDGLTREETFQRLRALCLEGARRRYGGVTAPVRQRMDRELDIIRRKGFADYFLMVRDIVQQSPRTCGRGSAAASIVSYVP